ncbi:hypothetical protein ACLB1Q_32700 [Escherichia coli]
MRLRQENYRHAGEYQALVWVTLTTTRERRWPDKTGWTQLIELATKTIAEGELDKVVLARATDLHFASPSKMRRR